MNKKIIAFGAVFAFFMLLSKKTSDTTTIKSKAKKLAKSLPKSKNGLLQVQNKFGYVPVSALVEFGKPLTVTEKKTFENWLHSIENDYGTVEAQNAEKIAYSETSRFTSLLFRATRNVGGILGNDIKLYIINKHGRNIINNEPIGKAWGYRVYNSMLDGLNDLLKVLKKHNFDPVAYSGNTVSESYWNSIRTKIIL